MYQDLKWLYCWDNMKKEFIQYVQTSLTCQQVKTEYLKLAGVLQLLEVPK